MFDVGFWELVLVFGLGLIILGPERLPRVAAKVGRWVGQARRTASQLRRQLEMEIKLDDPPKPPSYSRPKPPPVTPQTDESDAEPADNEPSTTDTNTAEPADTEAPEADLGVADTEADTSPETDGKH